MPDLSFRTSQLRSGSSDVSGLQSRCASIASDAVGALVGMAGAAGHPAVQSALTGAGGHGGTAYSTADEVYQQLSDGLSGSADIYDGAESTIIMRTKSVSGW